MNLIAAPLLLLTFLPPEDKPTPKFPLGKETTYITEPLDKDGYIDYEAALNDLLGKNIKPERNAVVLLSKAFGPTPDGGKKMPPEYFKRLGIEEPPAEGAYFLQLRPFLRDKRNLDPDESYAVSVQIDSASQRPWTAKDYPHLAEWLKANQTPLELVIEATKRPDYYNPLVSRRTEKGPGMLIAVLLPGAQTCREIGKALVIRAMLRVEARKLDDAWQDLLACHRLGRLVARGGSLIEGLIGCSIDALARRADLVYLERANLTAPQLQARWKEVKNLPPIPPLAEKLQFERFIYLDALQSIRRGGESGLDREKEQKALEKIDWEPALRIGNRWHDRLAAALRIEDREKRNAELSKIEVDLKSLKGEATTLSDIRKLIFGKDPPDKMIGNAIGESLIGLLLPAVGKVQGAFDRIEQTQRNLEIAFALAAYHRDNGRYPEKLDDLAPKYLAAVPNDLFSGKALIYRPSEKGYLFYSVGINGKDEDGHEGADDPPGDDLGVRMPLPELTRKK
jgi:hypothetical protein